MMYSIKTMIRWPPVGSHLASSVVHLARDVGVQVLQDAGHQPAQGVRLGVARVKVVFHHRAGAESGERLAGAGLGMTRKNQKRGWR